ncbi:NAD(P)H-hydrate dehydratase [Tuwongella immobilis]|uniref:ADP-dependent (S)-NAD(P)H-hydrate dehydratase n=1 Tax=Tuwongella immobilis TaxID=692036 RepID=A0A6C2YNP8_9BACT|nr:NAD(P)H-hydrate dehydratase [Tuwongella immobilis]VIP03250.1 carbohydrate kinase : ADP-dependent (S)-NAD(P)H-hydrate dehydratase OS=planctomycete KSU-1 GN=nnrD PE=3 SV=1: Carb_kinase [Tuwongella immobilis]VTS03837.1 carbohydrate kinase : ADP-dependent (S)-NAD(P)H-hydrate dehydratase OS=planctomycete KSU-1 GN=nnrD PE=3 SV=1: Carb_kinase [Tuwongella immobilis]
MSLSNLRFTIEMLPPIPARPRNAHKGDFGRVLIVAGSRGMSGAAILSGIACIRSGAGLVTIATPRETQPIVATGFPCYMTLPLPQDEFGCMAATAWAVLQPHLQNCDILAIGPGLGRTASVQSILERIVREFAGRVIWDADALFGLAKISPEPLQQHSGEWILSPHSGEAGRLLQCDAATIEADRVAAIEQLVERYRATIILKGHRTLVADSTRLYENLTGNPGMATGGCGDVLTGILAGLWPVLGDPWSTASHAVAVHGRAGDLAAESLGEISLSASDLLDTLPTAFRERCAIRNDQP